MSRKSFQKPQMWLPLEGQLRLRQGRKLRHLSRDAWMTWREEWGETYVLYEEGEIVFVISNRGK